MPAIGQKTCMTKKFIQIEKTKANLMAELEEAEKKFLRLQAKHDQTLAELKLASEDNTKLKTKITSMNQAKLVNIAIEADGTYSITIDGELNKRDVFHLQHELLTALRRKHRS